MLIVWIVLLLLFNLVCLALVPFALPGNWLMIVATALFAWWQRDNHIFSVYTLGAVVVLAVIAEIVEFLGGFGCKACRGAVAGGRGRNRCGDRGNCGHIRDPRADSGNPAGCVHRRRSWDISHRGGRGRGNRACIQDRHRGGRRGFRWYRRQVHRRGGDLADHCGRRFLALTSRIRLAQSLLLTGLGNLRIRGGNPF